MWPQAKINLVTIPPESNSYVTQVDICRVGQVLADCSTKRFAMSEEGGAQIFRALPGDSRWVRGRVVRQKGWLLLGGLGKAKDRDRERETETERGRERFCLLPECAVLASGINSIHGHGQI